MSVADNFYPEMSYFNFYSYLVDQEQYALAREYQVVSEMDDYVLTVEEIREHLKLDTENSESDAYFHTLMRAGVMVAEHITRKELVQKVMQTYFPRFSLNMVIKRSKVQSLDSLQYRDVDDAWQTIDPATYYINDTDKYPNIYKKANQQWPVLYTGHVQPIKAVFTVGYSVNTGIPLDLKLAIMQHIAVMYEYRGDWNSTTMFGSGYLLDSIPPSALIIYNMYRCKMLNL